ncbi:MAG: PAS domain S-box protein [Geothrix sp.]|nr:PAS domain S-box protein [Geothrix sp.]
MPPPGSPLLPPDPPSPLGPHGFPLDSVPMGIALSQGGLYLQVNAAFLRLFGLETASEILGRPFLDTIEPGQRDLLRRRNQERERTGSGPVEYETLGLRKDGTAFPMQVHVSSIPLTRGVGTLAFLTDISERKAVEARLLDSEERFRAYVEQSIDVIFTLDAQGTFTFVSPAWERHFGYSPGEVLGRSFAPFVHPEDVEPCLQYLLRVLSTGHPETSPPYRVRHADGSWRRFVANGSAMASPGGGPVFLGVAHDITEEHAAQEALRKERKNAERYLGVAQVILVAFDAEARITLLNGKGHAVLGYAEGELIGRDWFRVCLPPEEYEPVVGVYRRILAGEVEALEYYENHILRKDGEPRLIAWHNAVIRDEEGRITGIISSGEDITERRQAEAALRENEEQLRVIFSASDAGIIMVSDQGVITFANQGMADLFGMTVQEVIGTTYPSHLHESEKQTGDARMRRIITGEIQSVSVERKYIRADGTTFWGHLSGRRMEHPDGSLRALIGIITDVSKRREAEEQQRLLQAQLHQAQKMESLGSLAGGVAHDMNNVLAAILGYASAHIEDQPPGSPTQKAFGTIIRAAERGGNMIKSLLSFARQNATEEQDLDLNAILREEVQLLERTTLSKVHLIMDLQEQLQTIRGDPGALTHAVMNLCVNAVDAMPENGTLTLRTRNLDHGRIEVQVRDTGTGMPQEVLDKALDPFFTTKEVGKGTGLGLSIVYSTVKTHHGEMDIQSAPGQGTCVTLRFPASASAGPARPADPAEEAEQIPPHGSLNVLIVDDDPDILSSMQGMLDRLGHWALLARGGEEALELVEAGLKIDVIILDMNMPGLGGIGTLPRLRARLPRVPVLLVTGRADQTAQDLARAHPFVTLLPKPFGMKELQAHLAFQVG